MRVPDEMRAILRETGGLTSQLWARTERLFAGIGESTDVETARLGLTRSAMRLEHFAHHVRQDCAWYTSLLPPGDGQESVREMEDRMVRQLWQQYGHLGVDAFCERFHISRASLYRRVGCLRG